MTAKEMFEKLGYKYYEDDGIDVFNKAECVPSRINTEYINFKDISFHKSSERISIYNYTKNATCTEFIEASPMKINFLSIEELQAIDQQIKELGWK